MHHGTEPSMVTMPMLVLHECLTTTYTTIFSLNSPSLTRSLVKLGNSLRSTLQTTDTLDCWRRRSVSSWSQFQS